MHSKYQGQTGPKSQAGKRISSMNALKSGLFAKTPILPFEDEGQYKRHVKSVMASLVPEDAIQQCLVQQIADSMWRGTRQDLRAALHREAVFKELTPKILAELLKIDGNLITYIPPFLVTPNHRFGRATLKMARQHYQQYLHLQANVKGVANYNMVWRNYVEFFQGMHHWFSNTITPRIFMATNQGIEIHWQNRPKEFEAMILKYGTHLWYVVHFEELRPQIRNWMAIWFFLRTQHAQEVEQFDEIVLRERRTCLQLLETFFKMRKSQSDHALLIHTRLSLAPPDTFEGIKATEEVMDVEATHSEPIVKKKGIKKTK
jgi:hypothetical protein